MIQGISRQNIPECKVFACVTSENHGRKFRFKSYNSSAWDTMDDLPIWQACQATSAAPTFFPLMLIGNPAVAYIDGALGYNNPIWPLIDEANHICHRES
jgi:patatin-like phospholipase/acyl hydrolase